MSSVTERQEIKLRYLFEEKVLPQDRASQQALTSKCIAEYSVAHLKAALLKRSPPILHTGLNLRMDLAKSEWSSAPRISDAPTLRMFFIRYIPNSQVLTYQVITAV